MDLSYLFSDLRPEARELPNSGIFEVIDHARGKADILPMWAGEGDVPTPDFIRAATIRSLEAGETFYTDQRGVPELRAALARYHTRFYGRDFAPDRFFVTTGGMQAIVIAVRMTVGAGDELVVPTPSWPNIAGAVQATGARPVEVPMQFGNAGWQFDLDRLFDAATERTRALFINTPANPTGWTATSDDIKAILEFADKRGIWVIADEVYHRYSFTPGRPASFYDHADPDARVLYANTFSKNWAMTGWRIGWLSAPPAFGQMVENLIQYSTSGVATFMQRGATAALDDGEDFIAQQYDRTLAGRDLVCDGLRATGRIRLAVPEGALYLLFGIEGEDDAVGLARRLVDEAKVGLAPGPAFGAGGEGFMRVCFARSAASLSDGVDRLQDWLSRQ